ncbi:MAG TPA: amino acid ABC transporter permease [Dehalococcoidia bacterium]|nr:amino acid ABC transporter permease [Dehalococcoidia bacterium]
MSLHVVAGAGWEPFTVLPIWQFLLEGLLLAVRIAVVSIALSIVIGVVMATGRLAPLRPVRWLAGTYVEVFRATPLLLLMFFVFFGSARTAVKLDAMTSAIVALALYNGAVVAEIVRAGINSISRGIMEAGRALGLTYLQLMGYVAMPMALRRMSPGLVSQLVTLFKDTSLVSILGVLELVRRARLIYEQPKYADAIEVLLVVSVMYFVPSYVLSLVAQRLERVPELRATG